MIKHIEKMIELFVKQLKNNYDIDINYLDENGNIKNNAYLIADYKQAVLDHLAADLIITINYLCGIYNEYKVIEYNNENKIVEYNNE